jgi:hypothetical protein
LQFSEKSFISYERFNFYDSICCVDHAVTIIVEQDCLRDCEIQERTVILSVGSQLFDV